MNRIGEAVHIVVRNGLDEPHSTHLGLVYHLTPLIIALKFEDRAWGIITEPRSEDITYLGRMYVETKEEALTHKDWYIRVAIAPRLE